MAHPKPPEIDYLFPARRDLKISVNMWTTLALVDSVRREIATGTVVKRVTHYKSRSGKAHEKLLVELDVHYPESQDIFPTYIITERGPDSDSGSSELSLASSSNHSLSSRSQEERRVQADDRVVVYERCPSLASVQRRLRGDYIILCTVTPTKSMTLAQLAILLKVVSNHSVEYDLKYQCYWYAYTVWEVIRTHFDGTVTNDELEHKRGKYLGKVVRKEDSVGEVTTAFDSEWRTYCDQENKEREDAREAAREAIREAEERAEARGAAQERARWEAKFGPLND
jgi:hypothetical protein